MLVLLSHDSRLLAGNIGQMKSDPGGVLSSVHVCLATSGITDGHSCDKF